MTAPNDVYYEMLAERLPGHGEPVAELQTRGILLDGSTALKTGGQPRLLLQIFSQTLLGPVFFEFIQRKGDDGFGEGNFKACSNRWSATRSAGARSARARLPTPRQKPRRRAPGRPHRR
jgi:4-hydroxyphenylpyruvate dioxygenase-like putative hemolysin